MKSRIELNWIEHQLFCIVVDTKLKFVLFSMDVPVNIWFTELEHNGYFEDKCCIFYVYNKRRKNKYTFSKLIRPKHFLKFK